MKNTFTEITKPIVHLIERLLHTIKTPFPEDIFEMVSINN
jgi:hypothetical protein